MVPKLFDALKRAGGVTNYADLSSLKIIRKNSNTYGGGNIETTLNFIKLLSEGDQSQNIRIFDGDSIIVPKSDNPIKEQIILAANSNLTSDQITVFITGNVKKAGTAIIPKGSSLVQAIASAGGKKIFVARGGIKWKKRVRERTIMGTITFLKSKSNGNRAFARY